MGEKKRLRDEVRDLEMKIAEVRSVSLYWQRLASQRLERIKRIRDVIVQRDDFDSVLHAQKSRVEDEIKTVRELCSGDEREYLLSEEGWSYERIKRNRDERREEEVERKKLDKFWEAIGGCPSL